MLSRFLRIMAVLFPLIFTVQGCAVWVEDGDNFHHHHYERYWEHHSHGEHER